MPSRNEGDARLVRHDVLREQVVGERCTKKGHVGAPVADQALRVGRAAERYVDRRRSTSDARDGVEGDLRRHGGTDQDFDPAP
jgi:hypothetical protein